MEAEAEKGAPKKTPKKTTGKAPAKPSRTDSIVTARVPQEIREQGNKVLKKIGATPTELVNAAYEYVLEHEELPKVTPSLEELRGKRRELTPEQKEKLRERARSMTLKAPDDWEGKSFKELLDEARGERYARFA